MRREKQHKGIHRVLAALMQGYLPRGVFVTIVNVSQPQRGTTLRVEISIFPDDQAETLLKELRACQWQIRSGIRERIFMKHLPRQIEFHLTSQLAEEANLDKMMPGASSE